MILFFLLSSHYVLSPFSSLFPSITNLQPSVVIPRAVKRFSGFLCLAVPVFVVCVASQWPGITLDYTQYWSEHVGMLSGSMSHGFLAAFNIRQRQASVLTLVPDMISAFCFM
jgi:hypothetical protein